MSIERLPVCRAGYTISLYLNMDPPGAWSTVVHSLPIRASPLNSRDSGKSTYLSKQATEAKPAGPRTRAHWGRSCHSPSGLALLTATAVPTLHSTGTARGLGATVQVLVALPSTLIDLEATFYCTACLQGCVSREVAAGLLRVSPFRVGSRLASCCHRVPLPRAARGLGCTPCRKHSGIGSVSEPRDAEGQEEEASLEEQLSSCHGEDPGLSLGRRAGRFPGDGKARPLYSTCKSFCLAVGQTSDGSSPFIV